MSTEAAPAAAQEAGSESLFSSLVSFFVPTAHAEAPSGDDGEKGDDDGEDEDGGESGGDDGDDDDDEPVDQAPEIRRDCETGECRAAAEHFKHCSEKVEAGKGWEHEDCVEEMFHMMHCVDACAAPKLFAKLA